MQKLPFLGVIFLSLTLGYITGRITSFYELRHSTTMTLQPDVRGPIGVVDIQGVEEGNLVGDIQGNARMFLAGKQVIPGENGTFSVSADTLLVNNVWVSVPEGVKYVASVRGKKYYSLDSAAGERIVPQNRVYFYSQREAEDAGYVQ
ncbi:hypothetical protein COU77_01405 [Candidatus Peregrinibacteria bacterium CG10_big_fil_rev_8_21_14_0_10_49_16]|nr:MAG: hypothetical protein COW95_00335 [Candidatus Peregrinibacteria bacterium CG22_combo_CG10-13_8_21_14_all_49_11]PIR52246.1 MAG: hypothetical protein COU77_01405 [Candidatus Peregrinibacteria bacterium CG10_big_fil_rev_8_21_14_0_10_49_16]